MVEMPRQLWVKFFKDLAYAINRVKKHFAIVYSIWTKTNTNTCRNDVARHEQLSKQTISSQIDVFPSVNPY